MAADDRARSGAEHVACVYPLGVFRALSGSIALQRSVSTVCLMASVRRDAQNAKKHNRLSGSEMIEWE
jgi:hypothetical protein